MKTNYLIGASIISFFIGTTLFLYFQGWIILQYPYSKKQNRNLLSVVSIDKKRIKFFYWNNNAWCTEESNLIWSPQNEENILYVINNLLTLMHEEEILQKKISIESVMLSPTGQEAFISFERNPFRKEASTFEKWKIIESILKTIGENKIPIQSIRFLVRHKPLEDYHLDFSKSWSCN